MKAWMIILVFALATVAMGCSDDDTSSSCTAGEQQCDGAQIQTCSADGTWGASTECGEGLTCSSGHEGMQYVHCMADDGGGGMDHGDAMGMGHGDGMEHGPDDAMGMGHGDGM